MRGIGLLSFLLVMLFQPLFALCAQDAAPQVASQEIRVVLDPARHELSGATVLTFTGAAKKARLGLAPAARIESVRDAAGEKVPWRFDSGSLTLDLAGRAKAVTVSWRVSLHDEVSRNPAAEDPSYGVNASIGEEGTFLGGGALWYPVPEQVPQSRTVRIEAPAGIEAVTFGVRLSRETLGGVTRSVWREARPVGILSLCAGPYVIEEREVAGIKLYSYLSRDNAALAPRYLDAVARYLPMYQELFGPYPFEKYAVVENFFPTGYGFPSFTLLGGSVIRLPFIVDTSLPHEIAHSWWGNGVDVDAAEGNWCEGLVTYLADYLLKERRSAAEGSDYRRQLLIDYASLVTPQNDFPLTSFAGRSDPASRAIGYGKAAMVFHMIRRRIGDEAFFAGLRQVARERMYRDASWSDLLRAFSERSGADLSFFRSWLTRPGGPRLALADVTLRRDGKGWRVSGVVRQSAPFFAVELPLGLESAGGATTEVVRIDAREATPFTLSSATAPGRLLLDPGAELFRILAKDEIPATVNSVKGSTRLMGVVARDCRARPETFRTFLASLSQGAAPILDEDALKPTEAAGHDLVICGMPADRSLIPAGADLSTTVGEGEGDSLLFQVLMRAAPENGTVALFLPGSERAALQYAPKVTHYGKYGSLYFAGGINRRKGTAATAGGGAVVRFPPQNNY
ncbi:M1 family metallopeptidase [Geomonas oryzae]|uniref:M1 family metallopeptidase n=1 Tax=Geomonas oryzae TaxID=2364273 RepID=UPI001FE50806|nr:M1 family aminopeptidase [Geomonas oryzae]